MFKKFITILVLMPLILLASCSDLKEDSEVEDQDTDAKPVIYLYPEQETDVSITLDYDGVLTCTYPSYDNGWNVKAYQDGKIINSADNKEYSYLFWEGESNYNWNIDTGFVVEGNKTAQFFQEKLEYLGLTPKEYNEFIVYWLPKMQDNKYNLIYFAGEEYSKRAVLDIQPEPDSLLRVFMVFKALDEPMDIEEQKLTPFVREGFTVIEWGGTQLSE